MEELLYDGSKNRFRISSLCALIFGTVIGGGAAGAEPLSETSPDLGAEAEAEADPGNNAAIGETGDLLEEATADGRLGVPKICGASGTDAVGA